MENNTTKTNPKYDVRFKDQAKGFAIGDRNIIYNYFGYREEVVTVANTETDNNLSCPYRGLYHFSPKDSDYFFGRKNFIARLFAATQSRNFVPVLGASGSGKSSVVLAGLIPKLEQEPNSPWKFTHFRPGEGDDPFYALALALIPLWTPELLGDDKLKQTRKTANSLRDGVYPLSDILTDIQHKYSEEKILLIADQFEEIYTQCTNLKIRNRFLDCLLGSFQPSNSVLSSSTTLVMTMRADFLGNALSSHLIFAQMLQNTDFNLGAMSREELTEVIEKPVAKLEVDFEGGLVSRILNDVEDEPGNLPLLEFALTELWKKRTGKLLTHQGYEAIGEVKGALANYADHKYQNLTSAEQEQARHIFTKLVRPGEATRDTRRQVKLSELEENFNLITRKNGLVDSRLVVTNINSNQEETVEVVHEALIRNWGKLRGWIKADRKFLLWEEQLRVVMGQWQEQYQDEGALLRGLRLANAEDWLKKRPAEINEEEKVFINASVSFREHEKQVKDRQRKYTIIGLTVGILTTLGLSGFAGLNWAKAQISEINSFAQSSDGFLVFAERKALEASLKAAIQMQDQLWVNQNTQTQVELSLLHTVNNVAAPNTLGAHSKNVWSASFSPDDKILASASDDKTVKLWDTNTGEEIATFTGHTNLVHSLSFSPDGKMLASASSDKTLKLWDISTGEEIATFTGHTQEVWSVSFSPDGNMLASASSDETIKLWDISTRKEIKTFTGHTNSLRGVSFSPDGKMLASASADRTIKLWNISTGQEINTLKENDRDKWVYSVSFHPDGEILASASANHTVRLWNIKTGEEIKTLSGYEKSFRDVSFSPDGKILAAASGDNTVKLWDTRTFKEIKTIKTLTGHEQAVMGISFSSDSKKLASTSKDRTVKLWDVTTGEEIRTFTGHTKEVKSISFSPDGKILASASDDKKVKLWDVATGREIAPLIGHTKEVTSVSFSPDGKILASASDDKKVKLWDVATGREIPTLIGHTKEVTSVSFSPDGKILASASADKKVKLWNTSDFKEIKEIKTLTGHTKAVKSISFSPNGKMLASASDDETVKLWNIPTGKEIETLTGHTKAVQSVSFSPDGKMLASASGDRKIKLWNTDTFAEIETLTGHSNWVYDVSFSDDSKILASASSDNRVKLWDISIPGKGQEIKTLTGHSDSLWTVRFSPNDKVLASAGKDSMVKLWKWDFDYLFQTGCNFIESHYQVNPSEDKSDQDLLLKCRKHRQHS